MAPTFVQGTSPFKLKPRTCQWEGRCLLCHLEQNSGQNAYIYNACVYIHIYVTCVFMSLERSTMPISWPGLDIAPPPRTAQNPRQEVPCRQARGLRVLWFLPVFFCPGIVRCVTFRTILPDASRVLVAWETFCNASSQTLEALMVWRRALNPSNNKWETPNRPLAEGLWMSCSRSKTCQRTLNCWFGWVFWEFEPLVLVDGRWETPQPPNRQSKPPIRGKLNIVF